jgi:hypothetical protein
MQNNNMILYLYITLSVIFIFFTSANFSMIETVSMAGATDGLEYFEISKRAPFFAENIQYIKGERFILPFIIGVFSKYFGFDLFLTYKVTSFLLFIYLIKIFIRILKNIELSTNSIIISTSLIIFNPYLFRYFLSVPTMIGDLVFIVSSLLILEGLLSKNKTTIFSGFFISLITRQNGIIFFISFILSKLIFKKKSFFSNVDLIYFSIIILFIFSINTFYANNAAPFDKQVSELYFVTLFGLFTTNYSIKEFLQFIIFPFLSFGPLLFLFISKKINSFKNIDNELLLILILSFLGILGIAFLGGPIVTGKNFIRLSNFIFPSLIILINLVFIEKINIISKKSYLILSIIIFFIWSLHPTFSKIKIFEFLKMIFN